MTKEIHDINTKAVDFVVELIDYIFEYPDDDYMTMECLCRKLAKHGLLDKADGYYQTHEIHTNTHECVKDTHDKTEPKICDTCRYYNSYIPCGSTPSACKKADKFAEEFVDGLKKLKPKVESTISKMEQVETMSCQECKHWDCLINADWNCTLKECNYEPKDEPQTEPLPKAINGVKIVDAVEWADKWLEDNSVSEMWDMIRTLRDATEWQDEPQTYVINPQEPTNDDKCFECDDFFTCGGQCNKIEDDPQTERSE